MTTGGIHACMHAVLDCIYKGKLLLEVGELASWQKYIFSDISDEVIDVSVHWPRRARRPVHTHPKTNPHDQRPVFRRSDYWETLRVTYCTVLYNKVHGGSIRVLRCHLLVAEDLCEDCVVVEAQTCVTLNQFSVVIILSTYLE